MEETDRIAPLDFDDARTPVKGLLLSILVVFILSGGMPYASHAMRGLTWIIWIAILGIIYRFSKELPLWQLLRPAAPYLLWLCFYLIWALIVSPGRDLSFAPKVLVTTTILGMCAAILTARPSYLRTFASAVQFALVGNLLVFVLTLQSAKFASILQVVTANAEVFEVGVTRFGGLWGNPNMAGYICLVATLLSALAIPWIAWMGRLSCLPLLYLAGSRKSLVLYLLILLLYLVIVQRRNLRFWLVSLSTVFLLTMAFLLSDGLRRKSEALSGNELVSRLADLTESDTRQKGGETRLDLFQNWTTVLAAEPWYGYGLQAMAGTKFDDKDPTKIVTKGILPTGTHNTYLGVLVDVGPIGFIWFVLMMLYYAKQCLKAQVEPVARWVLVSFLLCNLIILFVSHNHLFCFEGKVAFTLFFLLPSSEGFRQLSWWRAESR